MEWTEDDYRGRLWSHTKVHWSDQTISEQSYSDMSIQTLNLEGHLRDLATFREDHNLLPSIQLAAKTYFNSLSYDSNSHYISIKLFYLHFKCCPTSRSIPSLRILHPIQLVLENFFHYFFKFCPLFFSAKTYPQQESWLNIFYL